MKTKTSKHSSTFSKKDIAAENVKPFGGEIARRAASLVKGMDIDLDAPLEDEVDI